MAKPERQRLPEDEIERLVILSLTGISLACVAAVTFLVNNASQSEWGVDTAIVVALVGVVSAAVAALGSRRNRHNYLPPPAAPLPPAGAAPAPPAPPPAAPPPIFAADPQPED